MAYRIEFSPEALEHLANITARERAIIVDQIEAHLAHEPDVETRQRKHLRPNPSFPWELRIEDLRVFYDIDSDSRCIVILAIGRKLRDRLLVGGREFDL